jgi:hypothetical protein
MVGAILGETEGGESVIYTLEMRPTIGALKGWDHRPRD